MRSFSLHLETIAILCLVYSNFFSNEIKFKVNDHLWISNTNIISLEQNLKTFSLNQIFWFPWCSTREDLSVDVSITYVGLILTKPG